MSVQNTTTTPLATTESVASLSSSVGTSNSPALVVQPVALNINSANPGGARYEQDTVLIIHPTKDK